jgi:hypothetical protein
LAAGWLVAVANQRELRLGDNGAVMTVVLDINLCCSSDQSGRDVTNRHYLNCDPGAEKPAKNWKRCLIFQMRSERVVTLYNTFAYQISIESAEHQALRTVLFGPV